MFDIADTEGNYDEIQRAMDFLFRFEGVRCNVYVQPQKSIGFTVDVDDFIGARGGLSPEKALYLLVSKKDFYHFTPLLVRQVKIQLFQIRAVKDMFRGNVRTSTRIQGILNLKNVLITSISQSFHPDFKAKRIGRYSAPGMMIRARTGRGVPELSDLMQLDVTFEDKSQHIINPSLE